MRYRIKNFAALFFCALLTAFCTQKTGSDAFLAPEIELTEAVVAEQTATLKCTVKGLRADRCGFLAGPVGEDKQVYPAVPEPNGFQVTLEDLIPERDYEWLAYLEAGGQRMETPVKTFRTPPAGAEPTFPTLVEYLLERYDTDGDYQLSKEEMMAVRELDLQGMNLTQLDLRSFPNLTRLNCDGNSFKSAGPSGSEDLIFFESDPSTGCEHSVLETLHCCHCGLEEINMSLGLELVRELYLAGNRLTKLNLYMAACAVETLDCSDNLISDLYLHFAPVKDLDCSGNRLESLRLRNFQALERLKCAPMNDENGNNLLKVIYIPEGMHIPHITQDRSEEYIPKETRIEYYPYEEGWNLLDPPDFRDP